MGETGMPFPAESVPPVGGFGIVMTTSFMVRMALATSALYVVWRKSAMPLKACWKFAALLGPVLSKVRSSGKSLFLLLNLFPEDGVPPAVALFH